MMLHNTSMEIYIRDKQKVFPLPKPMMPVVIFFNTYFFLFIHLLFLAAPGSQLWHVGSISLTRDRTWACCIGSPESQPLDQREVSVLIFITLGVLDNALRQRKIMRIDFRNEYNFCGKKNFILYIFSNQKNKLKLSEGKCNKMGQLQYNYIRIIQ